MDYTIIDAHSHLWLYQDTEVDGLKIKTTENGQSLFMGGGETNASSLYD